MLLLSLVAWMLSTSNDLFDEDDDGEDGFEPDFPRLNDENFEADNDNGIEQSWHSSRLGFKVLECRTELL